MDKIEREPTIGIFGPVGGYDIGDLALLAGNLDMLLPHARVRVFSYDVGRTKDCLMIMGYDDVPVLPDAGVLFNNVTLWLLNQLAYRQRLSAERWTERFLLWTGSKGMLLV